MKFTPYTKFYMPSRRVHTVFLHCSATGLPHLDSPLTIEKWHLQRGFAEIGYHFYTNRFARTFYCRDINKIPAAQYKYNVGSIALCAFGLHIEDFSSDMMEETRRICFEIDRAYDAIGVELRFRGHREVANKLCPVYDYREVLGLTRNGYIRGHKLRSNADLSRAIKRRINETKQRIQDKKEEEFHETPKLQPPQPIKKATKAIGVTGLLTTPFVTLADELYKMSDRLKAFADLTPFVMWASLVFSVIAFAFTIYYFVFKKD